MKNFLKVHRELLTTLTICTVVGICAKYIIAGATIKLHVDAHDFSFNGDQIIQQSSELAWILQIFLVTVFFIFHHKDLKTLWCKKTPIC